MSAARPGWKTWRSLFKSNDLAVRVFRKYNLWPILLGDKYRSRDGEDRSLLDGPSLRREKEPKPPGDWDAIRAAKGRLKVSVNRKAGTVSVSFESPSAEGSANIVKYFLDEGKSRLQEEALERATKNKKFIEEQIGKTVDALTRDRLYSLYGQEVEREMMARNREQFGFRVIDSPRVPDTKKQAPEGKKCSNSDHLVLSGGMHLLRISEKAPASIAEKFSGEGSTPGSV